MADLSRRSVVVARGDEHILEAACRMRDEHVGCLVVVVDEDDGVHPIGVVTDRDLLLAIIGTGPAHVEGLRLAELMSWDVLVAHQSDDVDEALRRMRARGVRRLPVVDDAGVLRGIIAYDDVVDWLGKRLAELSKLVTREQRRERGLRP
ncbi:MAG: CBS domain-containing protein [Sandaracinaceae bacterium]|nr:CBS domain-containing protein [Sandaracinaceae bacterium]